MTRDLEKLQQEQQEEVEDKTINTTKRNHPSVSLLFNS
jgi:hypothetical protein